MISINSQNNDRSMNEIKAASKLEKLLTIDHW